MKKQLNKYSLLHIVTFINFVVLVTISFLIGWMAFRSMKKFERFVIEKQEQEINTAVSTFENDLSTLSIMTRNVIHSTTLTRLQFYYDSDIFNYTFLEQMSIVLNQLKSIEESMPFVKGMELYLLDSGRRISHGSVSFSDEETMTFLQSVLGQKMPCMTFHVKQPMLIMSKNRMASSVKHNVIALISFSPKEIHNYFMRHLPDTGFLVYLQSESERSGGIITQNEFQNKIQIDQIDFDTLSENQGSTERSIDGEEFLLTWKKSNMFPIVVSQVMPMSKIRQETASYKHMITIFVVVSFLITIAQTFFLYKIIHKPLSEIMEAFNRVGKGDFNVRLGSTKSKEFQLIYHHFNQMTDRLDELIRQEYVIKLLNAKSELKQLQYQIRPHFLYNTYFNLQAMLMNEEYDLAMQTTQMLGVYMRYITISYDKPVTLKDEVEHAITYTKIQKMRFGDRLDLRIAPLIPGTEGIFVPRLIIQPLLENAFDHGIRNVSPKGIISLHTKIDNNCLSIIVDDNGQELNDDKIKSIAEHLAEDQTNYMGDSVALSNIHRRITLTYPEGSGLFVSRSPLGGLRVEIRLKGVDYPCIES